MQILFRSPLFRLTLCWLLLALLACGGHNPEKRTITRGFYYWKSRLDVTASEESALQNLQVKKLYVKFFDVVWNGRENKPLPVAKVRFGDSTRAWLQQRSLEIIPTIFITNECLQQLPDASIRELAGRMMELLSGIVSQEGIGLQIREVQFDCDWTATTKEKYFSLLTYLQTLPALADKLVSATIRLYQCKYRHRTGVPPVKRGLLMCYNMGNLKDPTTSNSILDPQELAKYTDRLEEYPLPLDIGWPLFNWKVLYRNNTYAGLMQQLPDSVLQYTWFTNRNGNTYQVVRDTLLYNYVFKKGDIIRQEDSNFDDIMQAAKLLDKRLPATQCAVVLFHLDSLTLLKYTTHELENIYNSLH